MEQPPYLALVISQTFKANDLASVHYNTIYAGGDGGGGGQFHAALTDSELPLIIFTQSFEQI